MNHNTFREFGSTLEDLAEDVVRACRRAWRELDAMPLPSVLVWCVALALIVSILPLALCLFVLFLGLKIIAGAFIIDRRASSSRTARKPDLHKD